MITRAGGGWRMQGVGDQEEKVACFLTQDRERAMIIGVYLRFKESSGVRWGTTARVHGRLQSLNIVGSQGLQAKVGAGAHPEGGSSSGFVLLFLLLTLDGGQSGGCRGVQHKLGIPSGVFCFEKEGGLIQGVLGVDAILNPAGIQTRLLQEYV